MGQVQSKECYFMLKYSFLAFVLGVAVFLQKMGFYHFRFHNKIFINQSETEIADKKLSVELYDDHSLVHQ